MKDEDNKENINFLNGVVNPCSPKMQGEWDTILENFEIIKRNQLIKRIRFKIEVEYYSKE